MLTMIRKTGTWKRKVSLWLGMVLLTGSLAGCGKQTEPDKEAYPMPEQAKGRYVETQLSVPGEWQGASILQIFRSEDSLGVLLSRAEGEEMTLEEWKLEEQGFVEVTKEWLATLYLPCEEYGDWKLMEDNAGVQYLYACYSDETDQYYQAHLWKEAEGKALDITPQKWREPVDGYDFYEYAQNVTMTDNGIFLGYSVLRTLDRFLAEDGTLVDSTPLEYDYLEEICARGNEIYLLKTDQVMNVDGVEIWELGADSRGTPKRDTIPFAQEQSGGVYLDVLPDGTMILADTDGFFKCGAGDARWQKLMEGVDTSFALSTLWCTGITALPDGCFYGLYQTNAGEKILMQYRYDPDAAIQIEETLTLFTVTDSYLLQEACVLYHQKHPEVLIRIESAGSQLSEYSGGVDYQQIYQELNTKLMAGEGPDILILDDMNIDTYASKGLLADIDDVVKPLEQDGTLLSNVTGAFVEEDGSRYVVPLQFGMDLVIARGLTQDEMASLENLAGALSKKQESYAGEVTVEELVDCFYPYFTREIIKDRALDRDALAHKLQQLKQIADNSGIVQEHKKGERGFRIWDIASRSRLSFYETDGFNQAILPISAANLAVGSYTGFEAAFLPRLKMAVNQKSEHQKTAKDFVRFVLSEEVQSVDHYEGFPVNAVSLETLAASDRSGAEAYTTITVGDGAEEDFYIRDLPKEDAERLKELCRSVHVMASKDGKIREELIAALPDYLAGTKTLEETLDRIEGGLKMYLAE